MAEKGKVPATKCTTGDGELVDSFSNCCNLLLYCCSIIEISLLIDLERVVVNGGILPWRINFDQLFQG